MKSLEGTIAAVARNTCVGSQHCHLSWIQRLLLPQAGVEDMDLGEEFVPFPDTGILIWGVTSLISRRSCTGENEWVGLLPCHGATLGKERPRKRTGGYRGCAAPTSVAAVQCPEKEQLRGEGLFWLTSPGYSLSFWRS